MRIFTFLFAVLLISGCLSWGQDEKNATNDDRTQEDEVIGEYVAKQKAESANATDAPVPSTTTASTSTSATTSTTSSTSTTSTSTTSTTSTTATTTSTSTTTTSTAPCMQSCYDIKYPSPRTCVTGCCISEDTRCVYQSSIGGGPACRCR
ncbi:MAG: hypothetical protein V1875_08200 [Candidatus Altiarchaeota archaeon]